MNTPMVTNLKLLKYDSSDMVDVTLYQQIIGSMIYLTNPLLDIYFAVSTLSKYMVELVQLVQDL